MSSEPTVVLTEEILLVQHNVKTVITFLKELFLKPLLFQLYLFLLSEQGLMFNFYVIFFQFILRRLLISLFKLSKQ